MIRTRAPLPMSEDERSEVDVAEDRSCFEAMVKVMMSQRLDSLLAKMEEAGRTLNGH